MWTTSGRANDNVENYLLVHDLSAPDGQAEEFAECIRALADSVERWASFRFVPLPDVVRLQSDLRGGNPCAKECLEDLIGISECDELYVGQNNKFLPTWLRQTLPDAKQICFGDGIALNFTNSYFRPKEYRGAAAQPLVKRLRRAVKQRLKSLLRLSRGADQLESELGFDSHCLLLKNLFDQQLSNVQTIDEQIFLDLFQRFASDFDTRAPKAHRELSQLQNRPGKNAVLLTSNFCETGRMSREGELSGYRRLLQSMPQGDDVTLIIKPHPRDSYEKIEALKQFVTGDYSQTISLDDPWTFYLPFESLYAKYLSPAACEHRKTFVATVSSACISLEHLYGQHCSLGFGKEIVDSEFVPLWSNLRQVHENDLVGIVKALRAARRSIRPARDVAA